MALLTEKRMTILTFAIIIVTILGGAAAIYYFQFNVLAEEQKKSKDLDAQLLDARNKREKLPELIKRLEELKQKTEQAKAMVPTLDVNEYDNFINTLDRVSRTTGVSMPSVKYAVKTGGAQPAPGQKKLPPTVEESNFDVKIFGGFYPVLRFLDLLEKNERFIVVNNYTISPVKGGSGIDLYELKLRVITYTYKASAQEQKPKEKIQQTTAIPD